MTPQYGKVLIDIREGALAWDLWGRLGWRDTRLRYQRTVIGPFWATLSLGIFVIVMGILWSQLWKMETKTYLPFLTSGLITWFFISAITTEGCGTFSDSEMMVKQLRISYTMLGLSVVWRNLIAFGHNLLIYALVFLYAGKSLTWSMLLIIPGIVLLCVNGAWISLVLGLICARYRDVRQLVTSLLQISMFLTPIFWTPEQLRGRVSILADYNPLYHLVQIVRAPLLGQAPDTLNWIVAGGIAILGWAVMFLLHARFRWRIAYWL